jgi:transcriptional regulator with XRE-family HTH domain
MKLSDYLSSHGLTYRAFSARTGFDVAQIHRWATGKRSPGLEDAARIRSMTDGEVSFEDFLSMETDAA